MMSLWTTVILAAGKGTRMRSSVPKVLHQANGEYLIAHVVDAVKKSGESQLVLVVGHQADQVKEVLGGDYDYAVQEPQLGTGHALQTALPLIGKDCGYILVTCGDTPLLTARTLTALKDHFMAGGAKATVLAAELAEPYGYGRLIRDGAGNLSRIVEEKDASPAEKSFKEINTGTYCFDLKALNDVVYDLKTDNRQKEYYLTDIIEKLAQKGEKVDAYMIEDNQEILGVNDHLQLAEAAGILRERKKQGIDVKRGGYHRSRTYLYRNQCGDRQRYHNRTGYPYPGQYRDRRE